MGSAKGRVDEKDTSRRERLMTFERKLETYHAIRECVGGPRWYSPVGDRCSVTWERGGTASWKKVPRSSDTTTAAAERTAQLFACPHRTQCESCCGCSVGWSWSLPELAPAPWQMTNRASLAPASHGTGLPFTSGIRSAWSANPKATAAAIHCRSPRWYRRARNTKITSQSQHTLFLAQADEKCGALPPEW